MAKKRYLYTYKKPLLNGLNQQEEDFNYFYHPKYAKIIGQKYGLSGNAVETAFKQYFESMKHLGLTKLINKEKLRGKVDNFNLYYFYNFSSRLSLAETDILRQNIHVKNSLKVGDFDTLFHEFNHLISIEDNHFDKWEFDKKEEIVSTGYDIFNLTTKTCKHELFNEGVTEFLAKLQISYLK